MKYSGNLLSFHLPLSGIFGTPHFLPAHEPFAGGVKEGSNTYFLALDGVKSFHLQQQWQLAAQISHHACSRLRCQTELPKHLMACQNHLQMLMQHSSPRKWRWYMSQDRISKFVPLASPMCFRCCRVWDTLLHIWWSCPKATRFWTLVYNMIRSVLNPTLARNPYEVLLHNPNLTLPTAQRWGMCSWQLSKQWSKPGDNRFSIFSRSSKGLGLG